MLELAILFAREPCSHFFYVYWKASPSLANKQRWLCMFCPKPQLPEGVQSKTAGCLTPNRAGKQSSYVNRECARLLFKSGRASPANRTSALLNTTWHNGRVASMDSSGQKHIPLVLLVQMALLCKRNRARELWHWYCRYDHHFPLLFRTIFLAMPFDKWL